MAEKLCSALEIIAAHTVTYDLLCCRTNSFAEHFAELVLRVAITEDDELALLEDALIFIREKTLRTTRSKAETQERALLNWAESCMLWAPDDGTLFSSCYYYELPLSIMRNVMECLGGQPHAP